MRKTRFVPGVEAMGARAVPSGMGPELAAQAAELTPQEIMDRQFRDQMLDEIEIPPVYIGPNDPNMFPRTYSYPEPAPDVSYFQMMVDAMNAIISAAGEAEIPIFSLTP